jgi:acetyl-CoA synthase
MSKVICTNAIDGAVEWISRADSALDEIEKGSGADAPLSFPNTAYYLPVIYSFTGEAVETTGDARRALKKAKELLPERPSEHVWLPYLGPALDAGVAALFACEIIEACKYADGNSPADGIWLGAADDVIMRERGVEFVDGTAPGFAAVTGAAPDNETAVKIARELQQKNLYVFMGGETGGRQFAEQLEEEGVQLGWETRLVPFGRDVSSLIYALGFANRAALSFGGVQPGDYERNLKYNKDRIFAFVLAFGEVSAEKYACAAGAINYGFPVVADTDIPEILPTGVCTYEHVVSSVPYDQIVEKALEVRGCKIQITEVPVPVSYGPAFEGERIRKADVHAEFGGNKTSAFEFATTVDMEEIQDGEIDLIGPDIDQVEPGTVLPLGIWVEVAGRKMQSDFEPILERQIHHLLNGAEGIWHMGQRDIVWTRVSQDGFKKGLRLKHYGEILHARLLADYPAIVDKVKVTVITDSDEVEKRLAMARKVYDERNRRLEAMTDESVDTFYSCLLCQSFAPDHVCIITPERLGLCGAYNWLDGKAAFEIDNTGPNQPVQKGQVLDEVKGVWEGVNDYVYQNSHKTVDRFSAYSIMDRPMTSCGCFEAICAYVPECNGVMVVNREYPEETPVGMTFSTLAGNVGGGQQTPGFLGVGKMFLISRKFLKAEGGIKRLVWMPKDLKESMAEDLKKRCEEEGVPDLLDKIADETVTSNADDLRQHLEKVGHPAVEMEDMAAVQEEETARAEDGKSPAEHEESASEQGGASAGETEAGSTGTLDEAGLERIKSDLKREVEEDLKDKVRRDVVKEIIGTLSSKFLGEEAPDIAAESGASAPVAEQPAEKGPTAKERISAITRVEIPVEKAECPLWTATLGAAEGSGGSRGQTLSVGGADCMPFHLWEGKMPNRPLVAMEVFDKVSGKYPEYLREWYGDLLADPAAMAKACVEKYGADLVSVRLEGTHPEKGALSVEHAVEVVKACLKSVDVPLIVTGHNHFETNNEVMKAVARSCEGENLLLNWVEQDNYRTIAGAALGYGHSVVAQSPIDVNIAKQLNILLTNMGIDKQQIVMDPMTGATGYGVEYTYSVMERIRLAGLGGDEMLAGPMIVAPGQECAKLKESKASAEEYPMWGDVRKRATLWEQTTALSLLYAGADILIMYNPDAVDATKRSILSLMDGSSK